MNPRFALPRLCALGLLLCGVAYASWADPPANPPAGAHRPTVSPVQEITTTAPPGTDQVLQTGQTAEERLQASRWRLSATEWRRFQDIRQSFRRYWSPDLDPLTTLGVHADSESERRRYAEMLVLIEHDRAEKELAFDKAYREAFARLYGNEPLVAYRGRKSAVNAWSEAARGLVLLVDLACGARCQSELARLQPLASRQRPLDIYVAGAAGDDARLRDWAQRMHLPAERLRKREITLNHEAGELAQLGLAVSALPQTYQRNALGELKPLQP